MPEVRLKLTLAGYSVRDGVRYRAGMKNNIKAKGSITKPLLAGLVVPSLPKPNPSNSDFAKPSLGKTNSKQADLMHDPGNGFNPDFTFIQD